MPQDVCNRLFPDASFPQPHSYRMPQIMDMQVQPAVAPPVLPDGVVHRLHWRRLAFFPALAVDEHELRLLTANRFDDGLHHTVTDKNTRTHAAFHSLPRYFKHGES